MNNNTIETQTTSTVTPDAPTSASLNNSIIDMSISPENPTGDANQTTKKKPKVGLIIGIIVGILVLAGGIVAAFFIIKHNQHLAQYRETAEQLLEVISNSTNEKSVFFAKDFAEFDKDSNNSLYSTFDDRSYIAKYDDDIYLCLNNNDTKISGTRDNLVITGMQDEEACLYAFQEGEREAYLYNYITRKYGYAIDKNKTTTERKDTYLITTDKGVIYASATLRRDVIDVVDDHETLTTDYTDAKNLHQLVRNRTLTYIRADDFSDSDFFPNDISYSSAATVPLVQAYIGNASQKDVKDWLNYLSEYLKNKSIQNAKISAWALEGDSSLLDGIANYRFIIVLVIHNGEHDIIEVDVSQMNAQNKSAQ